MSAEPEEINVSLKALPIFGTMRANLAMVLAFSRRGILDASNFKEQNLGFLGIEPGRKHVDIHNGNVTTIITALLYQTLKNYQELKKIKPALEYRELEDFLSDLESAGKFVDGMRIVRNIVFHGNTLKPQDERNITSCNETCNRHGGVASVMGQLFNLLSDFTGKVFLGELRIWPAIVYEEREQFLRENPDLREKFESGEIGIVEIIEAMAESKGLNV